MFENVVCEMAAILSKGGDELTFLFLLCQSLYELMWVSTEWYLHKKHKWGMMAFRT